jgi:hypothetical protein
MSIEAPAEPVSNDPLTPEGAQNPVSADGAKPDEPLGEGGLKALNAEREARAAAEKAAKDALARVKEFEDRDKSEAQKQQEALEQAQRELAELTVAKTRAEVAAAKGVPAVLLNGSTQEELEASADALIAFKGEQPKQKLIIPNEGGHPGGDDSPAAGFAEFMQKQLGDK